MTCVQGPVYWVKLNISQSSEIMLLLQLLIGAVYFAVKHISIHHVILRSILF